jgi:proline iminopeptidase
MKKAIFLFCLYSVMFNALAQERIIYTSDSVKLYVNVKGNGPACLYIHGGPGGGSYWLEAFSGDTLEQNFRMIYLDQRGTGNSSSPRDNNYSMERMIRDFEEVREALDIKQWIILGHSFAGIPMMGYVLNQPDVIIGLIFINCTLSMNDSFEKSWMPRAIELVGEDVPAKCLDPSVSLLERMMAISPVLNKKNIRWKLFYTSEENNQKMSETYSHYKNWNGDFSEKGLEVPDYWDDFLKLTSKVEQPVLFYYGIQDWAVGPDHYKGIEFPEMLLWRSEGGHMPFLENKDDLANAIRAYLNRYKFE